MKGGNKVKTMMYIWVLGLVPILCMNCATTQGHNTAADASEGADVGAAELGGIDLSTDKKIIDDPRFDFDAYRSNQNVIPFRNGYGINLSGVRIQDGAVIGNTMLDCYKTKDGRKLPGRLIRQVEKDGKLVLEETILLPVGVQR